MSKKSGRTAGEREPLRLLVLDGSYDLDTIRKLGLEQPVLSRDLDGFFEHVWSVHQFGDVSRKPQLAGALEWAQLAPRHTFIQARPGRFAVLRRWFGLNFALAQLDLLVSLVKLVRTRGVSIVRAGCPLYVGLLGWAVARLTGTHFMIRVNGNYDKLRATTGRAIYPRLIGNQSLEKKIERFVLSRADFVVGPNDDNIKYAVQNGADPARTAVIPYGNLLSPSHLQDPAERGVDQRLFADLSVTPGGYLLCVSRLQEPKFVGDLIDVLAILRDARCDLPLILAGEGNMRASLQARADALQLGDRLRLVGNLPQEALWQLYAHSAVVLSPLTGRALSEASLGAAPVVAYDLDWQDELIETGVTGELVPFRDVEAFAAAIRKLIEQPDYARRAGAALRERALDMLDPERLNAAERRAYQRVLALA